MRKLLILSLVLSLFNGILFGANDEGVKFENLPFKEVLAKAKKAKKPIFLDCYTSWCGPCKWVAQNIFTDKVAGKFFNSNFINVKIDMEKGEGPELGKKYDVKAYPTFLILDSDGVEISRILGGAKDTKEFIEKVEMGMDPSNSPEAKLAVFEKTLEPGDAHAYLKIVSDKYLIDQMNAFIVKHQKSLYYNLSTESMWKYISKCLSANYDDMFDLVLENKLRFDYFLTNERVSNALYEVCVSNLVGFLIGKKELTSEQLNKYITVGTLTHKAGDTYGKYAIDFAICMKNNDLQKFESLINPHVFAVSMSATERNNVENIFFNMKMLSPELLAKYKEEKGNFLRKILE